MVNTMSLRNEVLLPISHLGGRRRRTGRNQHDPLLEMREMDGDSLETLIHELGDMEGIHLRERNQTGNTYSEDPHEQSDPQNMDQHDSRRVSAASQAAGSIHEMSDTWMIKSGKAPLLTSAQEMLLAKRVEHGDSRAREDLLNANVRLVASVARRYQNRGLPLEDLMQEGLIGLLRAIEKYNYRKGYRFSTYATHWIRQAVSRALANQGRSIRLPAHVVDSLGRISRIREELFQSLGRPATRHEVAEAVGMTEKKLIDLLRNAAQPLSLETPLGEEGDARIGDMVPADEESSPSDRAFHYMVHEELEHVLNTLSPREKEVIILRYGIGDEDPHTLEETGRRLHITRERARQIEGKAMEKLRHAQTISRLKEAVN